MAKKDALIFIPDISGFTRFVNATEGDHSQHIIAELLEVLIDNNQLGMTLAEVEGDALFFYREGPLPSRQELFAQIEHMFLQFHNHLQLYEHRRICQCGACVTASGLSLKFIVHSGPIDFIQIKDMRKPYGSEIITAHRLMKNNVPESEYALITDAAIQAMTEQQGGPSLHGDWDPCPLQLGFEDIGDIDFCYYKLADLKQFILPPPPPMPAPQVKNPIRVQGFIDREPDDLFEMISNFNLRYLWNEQVTIEYDKDHLNRVGMEHQCVIDGKVLNFDTITKQAKKGAQVYGEHTTDIPVLKSMSTYFILEPSKNGTLLTIEAHPELSPLLRWLLLPLVRKRIYKTLQEVFENLKNAAAGIGEQPVSKLLLKVA